MSAANLTSRPALNTGALFKPVLAVLLSVVLVAVIASIPDLGGHAKVAFITFGLAIIGWTLTSINDTYIALAAAIVFAATGIDEPGEFFETLGDSLIWLLFASFLIAAAVKASGLSERLAWFVARRARSVRQLFALLTLVLIATAFLIPSTSGRAALMLPVFLAIRAAMPNKRVARALALLFPAVILLSAIASLLGAGAHLITADILWRTGGEALGYGRWLMMGLPFALASSFAAVFAILLLFTRREDRALPLRLADEMTTSTRWRRTEVITAVITGGLVLLWATESLHGVHSTLIALLGALLLTAPLVRVTPFKTALKEVDWGMLVFMAATLELGEALIESGGAQWLVERLFTIFDGSIGASPLATVTLLAAFGLLSHLVITSRSSRASVIIPLVIFLATALGFSTTTFAFMTAAATGFCLTLPVSAKPVAMFAKVEGATYTPRDLFKLSSALLPVHLALLVVFTFFVWPALGLDIAQARPSSTPQAPGWLSDLPADQVASRSAIFDLGPRPARGGDGVRTGEARELPSDWKGELPDTLGLGDGEASGVSSSASTDPAIIGGDTPNSSAPLTTGTTNQGGGPASAPPTPTTPTGAAPPPVQQPPAQAPAQPAQPPPASDTDNEPEEGDGD